MSLRKVTHTSCNLLLEMVFCSLQLDLESSQVCGRLLVFHSHIIGLRSRNVSGPGNVAGQSYDFDFTLGGPKGLDAGQQEGRGSESHTSG